MPKKLITITGCSRDRWSRQVKVSERLFVHLNLSLEQLCKTRDCLWRLELNYDRGCSSDWWKMATEAEALIQDITCDYSV